MAADELTKPLGMDKAAPRRRRFPYVKAAAGLAGSVALAALFWVLLVDDPSGGDPVARVPIERTASAVAAAGTGPAEPPPAAAETPTPPETGPRITRMAGGAKLIELPPEPGVAEDPRVREMMQAVGNAATGPAAGTDEPDLLEAVASGLIPRIGPDGRRPMDAYARPADAEAVGTARIAIVVGGLGISRSGTQAAIATLPEAVTLAFAPYGADLPRQAAQARAEGHELLLQVPLEPFDFPNNDPGPQTLLTSLGQPENVGRLHWSMSRFTGYVGIVNYMGARFTSDAEAMAPLVEEIGDRGLVYLDDGTSSRSVAGSVAEGAAPFAAADLVLDAVAQPGAIEARLGQLEALARERGQAIGIASAYPVTIEQIAAWAASAEERGVVLVPLTALVDAPPS